MRQATLSRTSLTLLLAVCTTWACGDSGDSAPSQNPTLDAAITDAGSTDSAVDAGPVGPTREEYCQLVVAKFVAWEKWIAECCAQGAGPGTGLPSFNDSKKELEYCMQRTPADFDGAYAMQCAADQAALVPDAPSSCGPVTEAIRAAWANYDVANRWRFHSDACDKALRGLGKAGQACDTALDCAHGYRCGFTYQCEKVSGVGGICWQGQNSGCEDGLYCRYDTGMLSAMEYRCRASLAAEGEPCALNGHDCGEGLGCSYKGAGYPGTCRKLVAIGQSCSGVGELLPCAGGAACSEKTKTCEPYHATVADGGACTSSYDCQSGFCDAFAKKCAQACSAK